MKIEQIMYKNFRNMESFCFEPCSGVNVIIGENAIGKTNLLEGIWLCTGEKSFRGSDDSDFLRFGCQEAHIQCSFYASERSQECELIFREGKKSAALNKVPLKSVSELTGRFFGIIFSPNHMSLVQNGPDERRKFIDSAIRQIKPGYSKALRSYKRALAQRNSLLKDIMFHNELYDTLDIWDENIARIGGHIAAARVRYIKRLSPLADDIYKGISYGRERLTCTYLSNTFNVECEDSAEQTELFRKRLSESRAQDIESGYTGNGPHRDDMELMINDVPARVYGSQGQKRSVVLTLKLSEAALLERTVGEAPIILLDDVMSELDEQRQHYLLHSLKGGQIFITACGAVNICNENSYILKLKKRDEACELPDVDGE